METTSRRMRLAFVAFVAAAVCALCMLPGMAFAATNVTVNYTVSGVAKSAVVDLEDLADDSEPYGYMFTKNNVNNVIKADNVVALEDALYAAVEANGDEESFDVIWTSGKTLTLTTDGGKAYTKFTAFTYDNLMAQGYFFRSTKSTGLPLGTGTPVPAVLALSSGSVAMNSADATQTAGAVLDGTAVGTSITTSTTNSPRLLWGWSSATPADNMFGGNRYPSNIDSITIS